MHQRPAAVRLVAGASVRASAWKAFSIGSNGIGRAGEDAASPERVAGRSAAASPAAGATVAPSARSSATVMRFSVSVPVLSVHSTVAAPSVSIAAARRVSTRAREIRHAPITMNTVRTSGNSSGSIDMPSAMPASSASSQAPRSSP